MKKYKILFIIIGLLVLTSCDNSHMRNQSVTQTETSQEVDYRENLQQMICESSGEPICEVFYFNNTSYEDIYAFVFTGKKEEEKGTVTFQGSLWYADIQSCILLTENIDTFTFNPVVVNNNHLLYQTSSGTPNSSHSFIWAAYDHKPQLVFNTFNFCFIDNELLAMVITSINHSEGGRIWQRYYLYWDSDNQSYQLYLPRKINEEEFLLHKNAQEVRDAIGGEITENLIGKGIDSQNYSSFQYDYFMCENGIFYINYKTTYNNNTFYYYTILREVDGKIFFEEREDFSMYDSGYIAEIDGFTD